MSDSERPTDPAPPPFVTEYGGDLPLAIIDRIATISDAVCSPEGVVAMIRLEARQNHESTMHVLKTIADAVLRIEAKVAKLEHGQDKHEHRIHAVETHYHSNGNGAAK